MTHSIFYARPLASPPTGPTLDPAPVPTQLQSIEQEANHSKRVCFSAIPCAPVTERRSCTTCCSTVAEAMPLVFAGASVAETIAAHVLARHFARCCSS